jgi:transcriptional regulator with XRE-family HTH domain
MNRKQIGDRIRKARLEKGWTQQELADKYASTQAHISDMERGRGTTDLVILERLLDVLDKDLHYLLATEETSPEGLNQAFQIVTSLPDGSTRDEAIAFILAIAKDARRRVMEGQE